MTFPVPGHYLPPEQWSLQIVLTVWASLDMSVNLLALPTTSSEFGRDVFSYSAPLVWNNLTLPIRSVHSLDLFKSALKPITIYMSFFTT